MENFITDTEKHKNGEYIVKEGTWAFYAYVLQSGKAKVVKNVHGKSVKIGTLNKGDIFGEMSFLGNAKRTASVIADGDVEVGLIPRDSFNEAINQLPSSLRGQMEAMVSDLTCISEVCSHLLTRIRDLNHIKERVAHAKAIEEGAEEMPEFMREVAVSMAKRLDLSVEGCLQLVEKIEKVVHPISSVSIGLKQEPQ